MNVGAPAFCAAWCPSFRTNVSRQFLAVHCLPDFETAYHVNNLVPHRGLLQIWDCGELRMAAKAVAPEMALGVVHDWGVVMDVRWCPLPVSGIRYNGQPCLGLVALACGDGIARVLAIPRPDDLRAAPGGGNHGDGGGSRSNSGGSHSNSGSRGDDDLDNRLFKVKPVANLEVPSKRNEIFILHFFRKKSTCILILSLVIILRC